jgi:hypothetical protein
MLGAIGAFRITFGEKSIAHILLHAVSTKAPVRYSTVNIAPYTPSSFSIVSYFY